MKWSSSTLYQTISEALWENNPISKQILGICSALAVTVQMKTAIIMGLALTFVVAFTNLIISLLRHWIPKNIRIIVEVVVIATLVILIDELLRAFMYDTSKQLSVFVGLIITNCIVMGRAETHAMNHPPLQALGDGLANGLGYGFVLVSVSFIRELVGNGTLLGVKVIPAIVYKMGYADMGLMRLAPGAFIIIGLFVWLQHTWHTRNKS